jgi:hypothetical protein
MHKACVLGKGFVTGCDIRRRGHSRYLSARCDFPMTQRGQSGRPVGLPKAQVLRRRGGRGPG